MHCLLKYSSGGEENRYPCSPSPRPPLCMKPCSHLLIGAHFLLLEGTNADGRGGANCFRISFLHPLFQTCLERVLSRGKSSGRSDDNPESFIKR